MTTMTRKMIVMNMKMMIIIDYMRKKYKNNIEYIDRTYLFGDFFAYYTS